MEADLLRVATDATFDREVLAAALDGPEVLAAWVPADACTLPMAQRPLRVAEFDELFAVAVREVERPEPDRLRLHLAADEQVQRTTRELVERESECCAFFSFGLSQTEGWLQLDIRVPAGRVEVLDSLARRIETILTAAGAAS